MEQRAQWSISCVQSSLSTGYRLLLEAQYASEREIAFCIKQISSSRCCTFFIDAGFTVAPKLKLHVLTLGKVWEEEGAFKRVSPTAPLQKARISRRAQLVLLAFGAHDFLRTLIQGVISGDYQTLGGGALCCSQSPRMHLSARQIVG